MSGIQSVLSITGGGKPQPQRPYLIPLDQYNNDLPIPENKRYFQYWPEEINDNKQTNWETKNIPGLSHPIYQWISGGAREISFTAIFTRDFPTSASNNTSFASLSGGATTGISDFRNVDIPSAIAWLRSFVYPDYSSDGQGHGKTIRAKPPQKLILGMPGMNMTHSDSNILNKDEMVCIMTQCDVNYGGFFHDGSPRIARVQLQFVETIQFRGSVNATDAFAIRSFGLSGYTLTQTTRDKNK